MAKITIKKVRSDIGMPARQKRTMQALGLRKMHSSVEVEDTPQIRGMVAKVHHMVEVTEAEGKAPKKKAAPKPAKEEPTEG